MGQGDPQASADRLVRALRLSAVVTVVAALALGLLVGPAAFALLAVALIDLVLARLFARGTIGPLAGRRAAEQAGDAAAIAQSDPGYNPYARED